MKNVKWQKSQQTNHVLYPHNFRALAFAFPYLLCLIKSFRPAEEARQ